MKNLKGSFKSKSNVFKILISSIDGPYGSPQTLTSMTVQGETLEDAIVTNQEALVALQIDLDDLHGEDNLDIVEYLFNRDAINGSGDPLIVGCIKNNSDVIVDPNDYDYLWDPEYTEIDDIDEKDVDFWSNWSDSFKEFAEEYYDEIEESFKSKDKYSVLREALDKVYSNKSLKESTTYNYIVRYDGWVEPLYITSVNPFDLGKKKDAYRFDSFDDAFNAWEELCKDPKFRDSITNNIDRTIFKIKTLG